MDQVCFHSSLKESFFRFQRISISTFAVIYDSTCLDILLLSSQVDEKEAATLLPKDLLDDIRENKICHVPDLTPENSEADDDPEKEYKNQPESVESTDEV